MIFTNFSQNRAKYNQGQIFPFTVAVIVVIIILVAITVNLGQLAIYKTDVSNAADAGALAGASVLSGVLLDFGLEADTNLGKTLGTLVGIVIDIVSIIGIPGGIAAAIALVVDTFTAYWLAMGRGQMGWANAKKTALQYAFSNLGVDEPRPTFKTFLQHVYPDNPNANIKERYRIYTAGYDQSAGFDTGKKIKRWTQPGFSRFMEDWENGFAKEIGTISPGNYSPVSVSSGYGWTTQEVDGNIEIVNSWDDDNVDGYDNPRYKNFVKVSVTGSILYPLQYYVPIITQLEQAVHDWVEDNLDVGWELEEFIPELIDFIVKLAMLFFMPVLLFLNFGYTMMTEKEFIDDSPIIVRVTRHREGTNLGLWEFKYGDITAESAAHAFAENRAGSLPQTIEPTIDPIGTFIDMLNGAPFPDNAFQTNRHLFETELWFAH